MKILLVNLPFYRLLGSHFNGLNLGIAYIASVLNRNGHSACIYNADFKQGNEYPDQISIMNNLQNYEDIHKDINHPIWRETVETILKYNPDHVGFSIFTANVSALRIVTKLLKKENPKIKIVVGGAHASLAKDMIMKAIPEIDYVIHGEGEYPFLDLVKGRPLDEIANLIYRDGERIIISKNSEMIENLDLIPFPEREMNYPPESKYLSHFVITSRGCPNNCSFCASPVIWNRKVRFRSIGNVIEELKYLKSKGHDFIQFQDDTFTFNKSRLMSLLQSMIDEKLNLRWICDTRLNCIDKEILERMKEAGCQRVKVGIESGNREILKKINKGITPEIAIEKTKLIHEVGLEVTAYFMIGFPGETTEDAKETIALAKKIQADYYSLSIVAPYFGTEIYNDFIKGDSSGKLKDHWEYFFHQSREMILTSKIDAETIDEFLALNDFSKGKRV